ncbi:membrane protein [Enterococcus saigonensis]|uniref:Membrane protein n=1 Tax=Enterococcus saigonensis TaxID=1805431 RepID=A0A679I706_9ENTE|nr:phage holin family protein [Enterococcus saigonensis]BCA85358.1 membrane protein [Enterococcus saigonensis]
MTYFQRLLVNTLTFIALAVLLPGMVHVSSWVMALIASFVLSILNGFVKPILSLLSLPLTFLTLGLFSFVINAAMLKLTSTFVGEMHFGFSSFGAAIMVAVIMSLVNMIVTEHNMQNYQDD